MDAYARAKRVGIAQAWEGVNIFRLIYVPLDTIRGAYDELMEMRMQNDRRGYEESGQVAAWISEVRDLLVREVGMRVLMGY